MSSETLPEQQKPPRLLYDKAQAAEQLSIGVRTLERLMASGQVPTVALGRRRLVAHDDLDAFVQRLRAEQ